MIKDLDRHSMQISSLVSSSAGVWEVYAILYEYRMRFQVEGRDRVGLCSVRALSFRVLG